MNRVQVKRTGTYATVELSTDTTQRTPSSSIYLLSADGVTLIVKKTTARIQQDSLTPEICFLACSSLQSGSRKAKLSAIAYTADGLSWVLGVFLDSEIEQSGHTKIHFATWSPEQGDCVSFPFFYDMKPGTDLSSKLNVQSVVMDGKSALVFLTQVSGERPDHAPLTDGHLNLTDFCVQSGKRGPDKLFHLTSPKSLYCADKTEGKPLTLGFTINKKVVKQRSRPRRKRKSAPGVVSPCRRTMDHIATKVIVVEDHASRTVLDASRGKLFTVPYLNSGGRFACLPKECLKELFSQNGLVTAKEHNDLIKSLSVTDLTLYTHDTEQGPVRIAVAQSNVLNKDGPGSFKDVGNFRFRVVPSFIGGNHELPFKAVCISRWFPFVYCDEIPMDVADALMNCYRASGKRSSVDHIGFCIFMGQRSNASRCKVSLEQGPHELGEYQLSRKTFSHGSIPKLESFTNMMAEQAMHAVNWSDPLVWNFLIALLGHEFCRIKIATQGVPGHCFGFANTSHLDGDALKKATLVDKQSDINDYIHNDPTGYLKQWLQLKGAPCVPTSCCWTLIGHFSALGTTVQVHAYFIFESLGIAVRIRDRMGQVFFGSMATHNTAVMLVVVDGKVHYRSNENCRMFAWGKGKPNH